MATTASIAGSSDKIRLDYMKLLVAQLQNQDPMEPMKNEEMASQLAQLSELEQLENMNSTFAEVLLSQQFTQATATIGKEVTYFTPDDDMARVGRAEGVEYVDQQVRLRVGSDLVSLTDVVSIRN